MIRLRKVGAAAMVAGLIGTSVAGCTRSDMPSTMAMKGYLRFGVDSTSINFSCPNNTLLRIARSSDGAVVSDTQISYYQGSSNPFLVTSTPSCYYTFNVVVPSKTDLDVSVAGQMTIRHFSAAALRSTDYRVNVDFEDG